MIENNQQQQTQAPVEQPVYTPSPGSPESSTPGSGYLRQQADIRRDTPEEPVQQDVGYDINELATKLGVDPNSLGQEEAPVEQPPVSVEDWYAGQFGSTEAQQFADNFKKHLGIDIKEVYQLIQNTAQVTKGVEQWRQQVTAQTQAQQLRQELGDEFDTLMPMIGQRFSEIKKANPKQAAALDNIDGARMLAALIRQEGVQQRTPMGNSNVPNYLPNRRQVNRGGNGQSPVIKMSDFINWSDSDVQMRMPDIIRAKQNGTFIHDI